MQDDKDKQYHRLDSRIHKWMFKQGWNGLRYVQTAAIAPILSGNTDVVISASTAAGKTEAFFLPACSAVLTSRELRNSAYEEGVDIIYISPLKALINDQYRRLEGLSELTGIQITSWHGDSPVSAKKKLRKKPSGILLITPESLEAMLINHHSWCHKAFKNLKYIVIDEFHAFLGTERGHQLISLLTRLDYISGREANPAPRVALSATLGNIEITPKLLRPSQALAHVIIKEPDRPPSARILLKGVIDPSKTNRDDGEPQNKPSSESQIAADLYKFCRGKNNLVFANSRGLTESLSATLADACASNVVPNEFFPHHGSLSKEHREGLEQRLQKSQHPTTAICTMTLELGIDIGKVDAVVQVTSPHTVSSLRQRLGRSGRRDGHPLLKMLIVEQEIDDKTSFASALRFELVQSLAMLRLLLIDNWFEPPDISLMHFSTLLHQILAVIAQYGGISARQLFELLCVQGVFNNISTKEFSLLLREMGKGELVTQLGDGQLALGVEGEKIVSHYTFYAVFKAPDEYRVICGSKTIGSIPVDNMLMKGEFIIFGGKRWQVISTDMKSKVIEVQSVRGGGKPPIFESRSGGVDERIAREMYNIYTKGDYRVVRGEKKLDFIDQTARELFLEGVAAFNAFDVQNQSIVERYGSVYVFVWAGGKVLNTLSAILMSERFQCSIEYQFIQINKAEVSEVKDFLRELKEGDLPDSYDLADAVEGKQIEKFDEFIPDELLKAGIAAKMFDIPGLRDWLNRQFF